MKFSLAFFALATVSQVHGHGVRKLQEQCPGTGSAASCTAEIDPVACGNNFCEYDNACLANLAGFAENACQPLVQCPVNTNPGQCTSEITPAVECGPTKCRYDSYCLANFAGFGESQCCGIPMADSTCTANSDPVVCGGCNYDNQCLATAAGYEASQCVKPCNPTADGDCNPPAAQPCNPTTGANCNTPPAGQPCDTSTGANCSPELQNGPATLSSSGEDSGATSIVRTGSFVLAAVVVAFSM